MAYDPTKPTDGSLATAAELRNQFAGLKSLIDDKVSNQDLIDNSSANSDSIGTFSGTFSDPPTQAEVQLLADKLNELIQQLWRTG